jgi:hypothetical protein
MGATTPDLPVLLILGGVRGGGAARVPTGIARRGAGAGRSNGGEVPTEVLGGHWRAHGTS